MDNKELMGLITLKLNDAEGNIVRVRNPQTWINEIIKDLKKLIREEVLYKEAFGKFDKERRQIKEQDGEKYEKLLRLTEEYEKKLNRTEELLDNFTKLEIWKVSENGDKLICQLLDIEEINVIFNTYSGENND